MLWSVCGVWICDDEKLLVLGLDELRKRFEIIQKTVLALKEKIWLWRFICIILDGCEIGKVIAKKELVRV